MLTWLKYLFEKMGIISTFIMLCPTINWNLELENLDMSLCPKPLGKMVQCSYSAYYIFMCQIRSVTHY